MGRSDTQGESDWLQHFSKMLMCVPMVKENLTVHDRSGRFDQVGEGTDNLIGLSFALARI